MSNVTRTIKASDLAEEIGSDAPKEHLLIKMPGYIADSDSAILVSAGRPDSWGRCQVTYYDIMNKMRRSVSTPSHIAIKTRKASAGVLKKVSQILMRCSRMYCTIGADPEMFVTDKNDSSKIIPAWTFLPAKGKTPKTTYSRGGGMADGEIYWDGFQAEFTSAPGQCLGYFSDTIAAGLRKLNGLAEAAGGKLSISSVLPVSQDFLREQKEEHVAFGCAPSTNAYGLTTPPLDGREVPYRFAGGHIHLGDYSFAGDKAKILKMVEAMDMILGVASVSLLGKLDNPIRRRYYGLPGEYRMPPHGLEYRVLSNAWLCHPLAMNLVYDLARVACSVGLGVSNLSDVWDCKRGEMIEILVDNDIPAARKVLERNKEAFLDILQLAYSSDRYAERAADIYLKGIESRVPDPTNLVKNWHMAQGEWVTHCGNTGCSLSSVYRNENPPKAAPQAR